MTRSRVKQLLDLVMTANEIFTTEELKHSVRMEVSPGYVEVFIHRRYEDNKNNSCHLYCGDIGKGVPHLGTYDQNLNTAERMIRGMIQEVISNITSIGG